MGIVLSIFALPALAQLDSVWGETSEPPVRVGTIMRADLDEIASQQAILLDHIRRNLLPRKVIMTYYTEETLLQAVKAKVIDFLICDALCYASIDHEVTLRPLAGLVTPQAVDADHMTASVAFVPNTPQTASWEMGDLRGKKLVTLDKTSFGGFVALMAHLEHLRYNPNTFFSQIDETQGNSVPVVEAVLQDTSLQTVGVLPVCTLEAFAKEGLIRLQELKIIGAQNDPSLACQHTTALYPSWVLASTPSVDPALIRTVTATALSSISAGELEWSFPPHDFQGVHNLLMDLKLGPYHGLMDRFWHDIFLRYQWWFLGGILLILTIIAHSLLVSRLVHLRTQDLHRLMLEQKAMSDEMMETRSRLQSMEKVQTISQVSTIFAHEMKQPLGAIRNFSLGLIRRSEQNDLDPQMLRDILNKVVFLTDRASSIVTHVRQYAKSAPDERQVKDLNQVIRDTLITFKKTSTKVVPLTLELMETPVWVEMNSWEIEFAVLNLLKNAVEAMQGQANAQLTVTLTTDDYHAHLRVTDNGPGLNEEQLRAIFNPLFSTKKGGMGLGLSIVMNVVESHGGRINARPNPDRGLTMEIVLPLSAKQDDQLNNS